MFEQEIAFHVTRDGRKLIRDEILTIQSEPDALEKVAFNYLSNALKYTPAVALSSWVLYPKMRTAFVFL